MLLRAPILSLWQAASSSHQAWVGALDAEPAVSAFADWLRDFRELHERARRGALSAGEDSTYQANRDELARAMLAAQRLTLKPGEKARRALRVAKALQLDLEINGTRLRTLTLDVSVCGFSTILARPPVLGELAKVTLRLPGSAALACLASITDVKHQEGSVRISAQFVDLPPADRERLELFIIDTVLGMFAA